MVHVIVQHKIDQWAEFERIFLNDAERRKMLGCRGGKVLANAQDPQNLFVVFEWRDLEGAQKFADGLETHEAMQWATSGMWSRVFVLEERLTVDS